MTATIILVCVLVALFYHFGIMQRIVAVVAKSMNFIMRVSGAEALSNVASAFVGQVEAQIMIRPYLATMTKSEILASMSGSLACIAGGILIVYANMGAQAGMDLAPKLITASLMAAPGALVIAKIVFPETEVSQTMGSVKLEVKSQYSNTIDAITHGAGDGFKLAMNVIAMLIGFIALIAMIDWIMLSVGHLFNPNLHLSLNFVFGKLFYPMAWAMGIPSVDIQNAATLLGQKLTINEFVAFKSLTSKAVPILTEKGLLIVSIAICGFANFSSVGMLIGGQRDPDAVPVGYPGRAGGAPRRDRDHGPRRRLCRRPGGGLLAGPGRFARELGRGSPLGARDGRWPARGTGGGLGEGGGPVVGVADVMGCGVRAGSARGRGSYTIRWLEKFLPLPLRERVGGRGCAQFPCEYTPSPAPSHKGRGRNSSCGPAWHLIFSGHIPHQDV